MLLLSTYLKVINIIIKNIRMYYELSGNSFLDVKNIIKRVGLITNN